MNKKVMRKTIPIVSIAVMLSAGFQMCFGDGPPLSITKSNENVILTWPQTSNNWALVETTGIDYCYVSNDVTFCTVYRRKIISNSNYGTNGNNFFVVLPIDVSMNKFYMLHDTNHFVPPPPLTMRPQSQTIIKQRRAVAVAIDAPRGPGR